MTFPALSSFTLEVDHAHTDGHSVRNRFEPHTHAACEIYINLTGKVSFVVEDRLYPIANGSVILTRPGEFHHCVYNDPDVQHNHICLYFSVHGNEGMLPLFFDRRAGRRNHLALSPVQLAQAEALCRTLADNQPAAAAKYAAFFQLIALLESCDPSDSFQTAASLPPDVSFALAFIRENLRGNLSVSGMADAAHVSVNTLERHFRAALQVSPMQFIRQRRLHMAYMLLREGASIQEACDQSGFSDYSHFIAQFRREFGVTPLRCKRSLQMEQPV